MRKAIVIFLTLASFHSNSQSVFGYWYGYANVKISGLTNNYLIELILQPEKNYVKGVLNYFLKNTYRSLQVKGNYYAPDRQLTLYDIPVSYHGSIQNFEVDCMMNLRATLRVAQAGSNLQGNFFSLPDYRYTCPDIAFNLKFNADISKTDSVLQAISEYKETYQVWQPSVADSEVAVNVIPSKVINYVTESEFTKRKNVIAQEIEVVSDKLGLDVYDNGEIDGDMISIFYNKQTILSNQVLTHRSIHIDITLDSLKESNEISMFAENLGRIPPNTALMIINDGKTKYEVKLSSSLEKNATIRIKRKRSSVN
jgi:hypothetical protein